MAPKLKMLSKLKDTTTNNTTNRRKSTSTHSTTTPSTTTTTDPSTSTSYISPTSPPSLSTILPQVYTHNHEPTTLVESVAESSSIKLVEATRHVLSIITPQLLYNTYIYPLIPYFRNLYLSQPEGSVERLGMWGCLVAGVLPVGCFVVGLGMAGLGCFIVTGSALLLVQMSCLVFMSCVLAPAGVLTALFVGLPSLLLYGIYSTGSFLLSQF